MEKTMKLFIKPALFLMPLAFSNLGAMEASSVSEIMADGSEVPLMQLEQLNAQGVHVTVNGTHYDLSAVPESHRVTLSMCVLNGELSEKGLKQVLSRASDVIGFHKKSYMINGAAGIKKWILFSSEPYEYMYYHYTNGIAKPWSLKAKLFLFGGIGALVGAYYYRDALKPMAQSFWAEYISPRIASFAEYAKQFSVKKLS